MGTPSSDIQPLQKIQNFAARLILLACHHHHSTPLLEKPHWLPISKYIKYKVTVFQESMCFNAINGSGPAYLWTATCLHSVLYTVLFFWHLHAENPAIQMQDSWLSHFLLLWTPHLEFIPTRPKTLLNPIIFWSQTENLPLLTVFPPQLISVPSFCYSQCVCLCVYVCACVHVCRHACMRACMCVCVCVHIMPYVNFSDEIIK